jgi:ubiquinone/menaquinone biosynthesis C-methylase UbiE
MLGVARRKLHTSLPLVVGDAEHLPFREGAFDLVVSSSSFHYWHRPEQGLAEIRRVLAPGGTVVITDWCDDYLLCRLLDALLWLVNPAHHRAYDSASCRAMLQAAGFEVERLDRYKISWLWGLMTARALLPGRGALAALHGAAPAC